VKEYTAAIVSNKSALYKQALESLD
jgi:hypothetical protein